MIYSDRILPASSVQMYQVHGNHIDAVMDTMTLFQQYIKKILSESKLREKALTMVNMDKPEPFETMVFSLIYGERDLGFYSIIAVDQEKKVNQFISSYPFYLAKKIKVLVERVWVWDNLLEATVECSYKDFTFCFFAADYFAHEEEYVPGREIEIRIGAMGMKAEEPEHGFSFEGQKAVDWLAKLGREPDYDDYGQVIPVHFSTEQLVAFFPGYDKCPDEASFQSPLGEVRERRFMDIDFYETEIIIHRDDYEVSMPFIFRKDLVPGAHSDMPLCGTMWIVGAF